MVITDLVAHEVLDSRGNPTLECTLKTENFTVKASVPSGASTGEKEAVELRDNDKTGYNGLGVLKACKNVKDKRKVANFIINEIFESLDIIQEKIDNLLITLDGTKNKSNLGANATLGVSLCVFKALAKAHKKELFKEINTTKKVSMPICMINILNGGMHTKGGVDIQEFMIVPIADSAKERVRIASEIFHKLGEILHRKRYSIALGDEGGYAPKLVSNTEALDLIVKAIEEAGYKPSKDVFIALDVAANSLYDKEKNAYKLDNTYMTKEELLNYYKFLVDRYPIISIEDPFFEEDFESLKNMTEILGKKIMIVGDDYFVTNKRYLEMGIIKGAANAILIKPNQIGTITEMLETINLAKENNYKTIISHRSGETIDTTIADLAVGLDLGFIKTGSISRGERICKYNRLMEIERLLKGDL